MKTAISIPDSIFESSDQLAKRLGLSRSELYVRAISSFLKRHREDKVTEALNDVYKWKDSHLDPGLSDLQSTIFGNREEW